MCGAQFKRVSFLDYLCAYSQQAQLKKNFFPLFTLNITPYMLLSSDSSLQYPAQDHKDLPRSAGEGHQGSSGDVL